MTRAWMKPAAATVAVATVVSGCGFDVYDLPLPGGVDTGDDAYQVSIEFADVIDLVPQSSVKVDDVSVGKVTDIELDGWHALVTVELKGDVELPDNAMARLRQTSLLGEKFVSLSEPADEAPQGRLEDGDLIPLDRTDRIPELEEVLSALSLLLNGGGLANVKTIVQEFNAIMDGREPQIRSLLTELTTFVGQLDDNKADIVTALRKVNHLSIEINKQKGAIIDALDTLPGALESLDRQRNDLVKMLDALSRLSAVGTRVIRDSKFNTLRDLDMLMPILTQLSNTGADLPRSLELLFTYPFPDDVIGGTPVEARNIHMGDFTNLDIQLDVSLRHLLQFVGGDDPLPDLPELPGIPGIDGTTSDGSGDPSGGSDGTDGTDDSGGSTDGSDDGGQTDSGGITGPICDALNLCRAWPGTSAMRTVETSHRLVDRSDVDYDPDVARLLLGAVVAP
ncbi:MAG TPA: MCE family protein [Nocardioidaceae bacterium]|nr:MCE family protein [Nocardioidaceae bacterium]